MVNGIRFWSGSHQARNQNADALPVTSAALQHFISELEVVIVTPRGDDPAMHLFEYYAARFILVDAVIEAAVAGVAGNLVKAENNVLFRDFGKVNPGKAGSISYVSTAAERKQGHVGGRVHSPRCRATQFPDSQIHGGKNLFKKRAFSHATRSGERREPAVAQVKYRVDPFAGDCRADYHRISCIPVDISNALELTSFICGANIRLVEEQAGLDVVQSRIDEQTVEIFKIERRFPEGAQAEQMGAVGKSRTPDPAGSLCNGGDLSAPCFGINYRHGNHVAAARFFALFFENTAGGCKQGTLRRIHHQVILLLFDHPAGNRFCCNLKSTPF